MRVHDEKFKEDIKEYGREINSKVYYGGEIYLTDDDIVSLNIIQHSSLMKTYMREVDIECTKEIPVGSEIYVYSGVNENYINYGQYFVRTSKYNEDTKTYSLVCNDKMVETMIDYKELNITYPITIHNYIIAILEKCGFVGLSEFFEDNYVNADKLIYEDNFKNSNYTYRDVLDYVMELTGGILQFNNLNPTNIYPEVIYAKETGDVINGDYLNEINVKFTKKYGPVNSLVFSRAVSDGEDNLYRKDQSSIDTYGLCEIKLKNNPFLNEENRETYIDELFNKLKGLEYYIMDVDSKGIMYYEPGDIYTIRTSDIVLYPSDEILDNYTVKSGMFKSGITKASTKSDYTPGLYPSNEIFPVDEKSYKCLLLNDDININQGLSETIYNDEPSETETDYKTSTPSDKAVKDAVILTNKNAGQIVLKATSDGKIVQAELNADAENGSEFNVKADNIKLEGYTTINDGFGVDLKGNMICNNSTANDLNINGGNITLYDSGSTNDPRITIHGTSENRQMILNSVLFQISGGGHSIWIQTLYDDYLVDIDQKFMISPDGDISHYGNYNCYGDITCNSLTQTSLKENKKNFEKYFGALDEVKNIDIYKYNLKDETNDTKKHLGFVIGDGFNYSEIVTSDNNKGVDTYSFTSLCLQAIKEQQELIENLQKQINELKESDNKCKK